jgi:high-affinity Fe2+/Pb2+ permease
VKQPDAGAAEEPDYDEKGSGSAGRNETEKERIDRNLIELLNELRVALPGVQVLFAFLLVLPFSQGFADVTDFQKIVFLVTLLATALSAIMLIAPSMHHRLQFREGNKAEILRDANRLAVLGMTSLAVAMVGAVMLITDFVFDSDTMIVVVAAVSLTFLIVWYLMPGRRLASKRREDG